MIFANSPQGKGRIERWFQVPQDRLVAELRTYKIERANNYLKEVFLAEYWRKEKLVKPRSEVSKYKPLAPEVDLSEIFSMRYTRKINYDNTFRWKKNIYQILNPPGSVVNQEVELRFYKNGESSVYFADRKLEVQLWTEDIQIKSS